MINPSWIMYCRLQLHSRDEELPQEMYLLDKKRDNRKQNMLQR